MFDPSLGNIVPSKKVLRTKTGVLYRTLIILLFPILAFGVGCFSAQVSGYINW